MADANRMMELQQELLALSISDWYEKLFSFQWFVIVFILVVPWIIWWKLVNKKYIAEIFSFGLLILAVGSFLNGIGTQYFWSYPYTLLPGLPRVYMITYSVLPVVFMLLYQYFRAWKSFAIATIVSGLVGAFVLQPIMVWLDMMTFIRWNYFYSFLAYIVAGLAVRLLHQAVLHKGPIPIKDVDDTAEIKKQPGLVSPAFKRLINKNKP